MNLFLSRRVQEGLVLASASPRRREILSDLGFEFEVLPSAVCEDGADWTDPAAAAGMLAAMKAEDVKARRPMKTIIAADTVVVCEGKVLGKPSGREEAAGMLRELSGKGHEVITGVALCAPPDHRLVEVERTAVFFRDLSEGEIGIYSGLDEPLDKAGAYAIQGHASIFVERIEGDYLNVVGLPVSRLFGMFRKLETRIGR